MTWFKVKKHTHTLNLHLSLARWLVARALWVAGEDVSDSTPVGVGPHHATTPEASHLFRHSHVVEGVKEGLEGHGERGRGRVRERGGDVGVAVVVVMVVHLDDGVLVLGFGAHDLGRVVLDTHQIQHRTNDSSTLLSHPWWCCEEGKKGEGGGGCCVRRDSLSVSAYCVCGSITGSNDDFAVVLLPNEVMVQLPTLVCRNMHHVSSCIPHGILRGHLRLQTGGETGCEYKRCSRKRVATHLLVDAKPKASGAIAIAKHQQHTCLWCATALPHLNAWARVYVVSWACLLARSWPDYRSLSLSPPSWSLQTK